LSPPHRHPSCRTAPAGGTSARSLIFNDPGGARRDCFFFMSALAAFPFLAAEGRALLPLQLMPLLSGTTPGATATPRYGALTTPSLFSDAARNSTRGHGTCRRGCRPSKSDPLVGQDLRSRPCDPTQVWHSVKHLGEICLCPYGCINFKAKSNRIRTSGRGLPRLNGVGAPRDVMWVSEVKHPRMRSTRSLARPGSGTSWVVSKPSPYSNTG
jgi:hypothetical protein